MKVVNSILELIGNTPLIKIKYRYSGRENYIYSKLESYNLTGSIKDRVAYYIINKATKRGELKNSISSLLLIIFLICLMLH